MPGLFVSYRRVDARGWAGRLFDHLARRLGRAQVFMDVEGGIPRGASFPKVLADALAGCSALAAIIGPEWTTCTRDGRRRILCDDDWVRNEIRAALARKVPVVPVLVGGAPLPAAADLPDDLKPLLEQQKAEVSDERWAYDVGELVKDLAQVAHLSLVDDVADATGGLRLLRELIVSTPAVAEAVGRSREVIANTSRQIGALEVHKAVHDALHVIEFECLRPLEAGSATAPLRRYKVAFADADRRIREAVRGEVVRPELGHDLVEALDAVAKDFADALASQDPAVRARLVEDLRALLRGLPSELDHAITDAARELELERLVALMDAVGERLGPQPGGPELAPIRDGIEGLRRLEEELAGRVSEHATLQDLDFKLRTTCEAGTSLAALPAAWKDLERTRRRLPAPAHTAELALAGADLQACAADVAAALERGAAVGDLLEAYSSVVSSTFRSVDAGLRDFCLRLSGVSQPLELVLDMCRVPAA